MQSHWAHVVSVDLAHWYRVSDPLPAGGSFDGSLSMLPPPLG